MFSNAFVQDISTFQELSTFVGEKKADGQTKDMLSSGAAKNVLRE